MYNFPGRAETAGRTETAVGSGRAAYWPSRDHDYEASPRNTSLPMRALRESWWMKQLGLLVLLQAGSLAFGLLLHSTAVGQIQFPRPDIGGNPLSAGTLPVGSAAVTTFVWIATLQAVFCYLVFGRLYHRMREHSAEMNSFVLRKDDELSRTREAIVVGMSQLAETREGDSDGHHSRVGQFSELLARAAAQHPEFADQITPDFIRCIRASAMLHDIGKVGVQDSILMKPGKLTVAERRVMEHHTRISSQCLGRMEACLGDANFLQMAHRTVSSRTLGWHRLPGLTLRRQYPARSPHRGNCRCV
ncbi:HD domain-containing protein [bacterium]|nr:HD domain-containing protein [bacterium]